MDDDARDHFQEAARSHFDHCAGDDLISMAKELEELRDFLLGLARRRLVPANEETIRYMAAAEEAVRDLLADRWQQCQSALEQATDKELEEVDTLWMGKTMPDYFSEMTVTALRGLLAHARQPRTPTNPTTLIAVAALDAKGAL
jgi:hypothetical protein